MLSDLDCSIFVLLKDTLQQPDYMIFRKLSRVISVGSFSKKTI